MVWRRMKGGTTKTRRGAGRRDPAAMPSSSWAQRWVILINATRVQRRRWRRRRRLPSLYDVGLVMEGGGRQRRRGSNRRQGGQGQSGGHAHLASLRRKQRPPRDLRVGLLWQGQRVPCLRCREALRQGGAVQDTEAWVLHKRIGDMASAADRMWAMGLLGGTMTMMLTSPSLSSTFLRAGGADNDDDNRIATIKRLAIEAHRSFEEALLDKVVGGDVVGRLELYHTYVLSYSTYVLLARPTKVRR
jgi:hypothetical protein